MAEKYDMKIDPNNIEVGALKLLKHLRPDWNEDDIKIKVFTGGFSNRLVGCKLRSDAGDSDMILVRIYGSNSDTFIDRRQEIVNLKLLHDAGCGRPFYCSFDNGICYGFAPGSCLTAEQMRDPKICRLIAQEMIRMQNIKPDRQSKELLGPKATYDERPCSFIKCRQFLTNVVDIFQDGDKTVKFRQTIGLKSNLESELNAIEKFITSLDCPVVFSHNNLLYNNIVHNQEEDRVYFIDLEYGACNYLPFDIANHFCEYIGVAITDSSLFPDQDYRLTWIKMYLGLRCESEGREASSVTDGEVEELNRQVNMFIPVAHLFWSLWALAQTSLSDIDFDYFGYALFKWNEYKQTKHYLRL